MKYNIETDTGYEHRDCGPWRSYELVAEGNTLEELIEDAYIFEIDQDGGSLSDYKLEDTGGQLYDDAVEILTKAVK